MAGARSPGSGMSSQRRTASRGPGLLDEAGEVGQPGLRTFEGLTVFEVVLAEQGYHLAELFRAWCAPVRITPAATTKPPARARNPAVLHRFRVVASSERR